MIHIWAYNDIDRQQWRTLVQRAETATWFQTEEAYLFFASLAELKAFVFGVEENGRLMGVMVGYVTVEKSSIRQFFMRRAICVGGPLLDESISREALCALLHIVRTELSEQAIYIETRNLNDYSRWTDVFVECGFVYVPHLNYHIECVQERVLQIRMHETRRRQVRNGLKNGATISEAQNEQEIHDYYHILRRLYRKKVRTPLPSETFFLAFFRQQRGKYLLVKYEGKVIGGIMCPILDGKTIYEWYVCGQDEQYKEQHPSVMATYAAMCYGTQHSLQRFDFMGAGNPDKDYGVRAFKAQWGGGQVAHGRFLLVCKPFLYQLGKLGVALLRMG